MRLFVVAVAGMIFLAVPAHPLAVQKPKSESESVRRFVQGFYSWYVSLPERQQDYDTALRSKRSEFTPRLLRAFASMERREKTEGEIIDMDPFLNSQDPEGSHYTVGKVTKKGSSYRVDVDLSLPAADVQDRRSPDFRNPFVIAVVDKAGGRYRFADFYYPNAREGLLDMLK